MFCSFVILLSLSGSWCIDNHGHTSNKTPPPYVQSKKDFIQARLALQELVPHDAHNLTDPKKRVHLSGGVMAAVTMAVGKSLSYFCATYDPLDILQKTVPAVFDDYNGVAADPLNNKLAEINTKIQPIISIIDSICPALDIDDCNAAVENNIRTGYLRNCARLLLAVGKVSHTLNDREKEIQEAAKANNAVPQLIKLIQTEKYKEFAFDIGTVDLLLSNDE